MSANAALVIRKKAVSTFVARLLAAHGLGISSKLAQNFRTCFDFNALRKRA